MKLAERQAQERLLIEKITKQMEEKKQLINKFQKEKKDVSQMSKQELSNRAMDIDFLLKNVWINQAEIKYSFVLEKKEIEKKLQEI